MFRNLNWKAALRRALEVFLAALLGGGGTFLALQQSDQPVQDPSTYVALAPESLG